MATLGEIRTGLETRLKTISGLRVYRRWPDSIAAPAVMVKRVKNPNQEIFGNSGTFSFEIVIAVQVVNLERAQDALDLYVDFSGTNSILKALKADESLGGKSDLTEIGTWGPDEGMQFPEGGPEYLSATLPVEVSVKW